MNNTICLYITEMHKKDLAFFQALFHQLICYNSYEQIVMECDSQCACLLIPLFTPDLSSLIRFAHTAQIPLAFYEKRKHTWHFYRLNEILPNVLPYTIHDHALLLKKGCEQICIVKHEIVYIESDKMYINIHTTSQTIRLRMQLKDILVMLNERMFRRCHQSFIVNMEYIYTLKRYEITMRNGEIIPISKAYSKQIRREFQQLFQEG